MSPERGVMVELSVSGLNHLQAQELKKDLISGAKLKGQEVRLEEEKGGVDSRLHGEPSTVLLSFMITQAAINVLAAWLMKTRKHRTKTVEISVEKPDGTKMHLHVNESGSTEESAKADVIEQLKQAGVSLPGELGQHA
jgi:hypothetical protein